MNYQAASGAFSLLRSHHSSVGQDVGDLNRFDGALLRGKDKGNSELDGGGVGGGENVMVSSNQGDQTSGSSLSERE